MSLRFTIGTAANLELEEGRKMGLEVIGSGFGRTATRSLKDALEHLGFGPCHQMQDVFGHPEQVPHWQAIAAGEPVDWNRIFSGYRSQIDWPGAYVWRELATAYPHAKVVHSRRSDESWWNSFSQTIAKAMAASLEAPLPPHMRTMMFAAHEMISTRTFGGNPGDRDTALAAYRRRTEDVRAAIPKERLLVFNVADGWEPLCNLLAAPIPATPSPRKNSAAEFWETIGRSSH
jgi:Sulfotransferase domain